MVKIVVKSKIIKYNINIIFYLSFLLLSLVIKLSYWAHLSILIILESFYYKIPCYLSHDFKLLI